MYTIAIIDDELHARINIRSFLENSALPLTIIGEAADGEQAIELIIEQLPDIVIIDINMPILSGLEVISAIKEKDIQCEFILLTGYNDFSYAQQAIRLNVCEYALKPINESDLKLSILEVINLIEKKKSLSNKLFFLENNNNALMLSDFFTSFTYNSTLDIENAAEQLNIFGIDPAIFLEYHLISIDCPNTIFEHTVSTLREIISNTAFVLFYNGQNQIHIIYPEKKSTSAEVSLNQLLSFLNTNHIVYGISKKNRELASLPIAYSQSYAELHISKNDASMQVTSQILDYIHDNLSNPTLSIQEIANNIYMNYSYICFCFKRDMNLTINEYITQKRIQTAKELFLSGHTNITAVSQMVGYSSNSYFSKNFKKHVGVSPSEFLMK